MFLPTRSFCQQNRFVSVSVQSIEQRISLCIQCKSEKAYNSIFQLRHVALRRANKFASHAARLHSCNATTIIQDGEALQQIKLNIGQYGILYRPYYIRSFFGDILEGIQRFIQSMTIGLIRKIQKRHVNNYNNTTFPSSKRL